MPWRVRERYFALDYLTPGVRETEDLALQHITSPDGSQRRILEIASGKGTTALKFASQFNCRVVGVDPYLPFVKDAVAKANNPVARAFSPLAAASFVFAEGGRAPVRDNAFDGAICIGAPSIVGTARCFRAMFRALRPGGIAVASDWTWATDSPPPEAVPAGVKPPHTTLDAYTATIREAGFEIIHAEPMPHSVWDDYYAPLRIIVAEERAAMPTFPEDPIESEIKAYDAGGHLWQYSAFVARKPS